MEDSDYPEEAAAATHDAHVEQDNSPSPEPPTAEPSGDGADSGDGRSLRARKAALAAGAAPSGRAATTGLRQTSSGSGPGRAR